MSSSPPELLILLPVYNEQASIRKVVLEWFQEVENWTEEFVFLAIDDGSRDGTTRLLNRLQQQLGPRLEVVQQENRGHGQTCLRGYRTAIERGIPFVLQIDSDGQCDPQYFFRFWRRRAEYDVIYGRRVHRDDGWRRTVASLVLKWTLFFTRGVWCVDANVPYRLLRTKVLPESLDTIGPDFFLANVALAVQLRRQRSVRHESIPIHFRERYGGEPTVPLQKFGGKAIELVQQLCRLKKPDVRGS